MAFVAIYSATILREKFKYLKVMWLTHVWLTLIMKQWVIQQPPALTYEHLGVWLCSLREKFKYLLIPTSQDTSPLGAIVLRNYTISKACNDCRKPFSFKVVKGGGRSYYLCAESEAEMSRWSPMAILYSLKHAEATIVRLICGLVFKVVLWELC